MRGLGSRADDVVAAAPADWQPSADLIAFPGAEYLARVRAVAGVVDAPLVGSYRRMRDTVEDLDLLSANARCGGV